jgi:hypothetical protein
MRKLIAATIGVAALAGCGSTKTITQTNTVIQTHTVTVVRRAAAAAPRTITKTVAAAAPAPAPSSSASPGSGGGGQSWSGNGTRKIGTITVQQDSEIKWTNDGGLFQIFDNENAVEVNSQASSGQSAISAGTYHAFEVNAAGNWTVQIVPG